MKVLLVIAAVLVLGDCLPFNNINFKKLLPALSNGVKTAKRQLGDTTDPQLVVQVMFLMADNDNNGKLSGSEIASFMVTFGGLTQEEATLSGIGMIAVGDTNGDNELNNAEALHAVTVLIALGQQQGM